jgi:quinol monooxygenase YgiN
MILIVVKNRIRPEYADDWPQIAAEFTAATRAEPGNVSFDWYRSVEDPNVYVLVEAFEDAAAGEAHVSTDHFKAAGKLLAKSLAAVPDIVHVEVPEGWSRMAEVPAVEDR